MFNTHEYRHSYNNLLDDLGIDAKTRQALMGHSDITTTQNIYTNPKRRRMRIANEMLEKELLKNK